MRASRAAGGTGAPRRPAASGRIRRGRARFGAGRRPFGSAFADFFPAFVVGLLALGFLPIFAVRLDLAGGFAFGPLDDALGAAFLAVGDLARFDDFLAGRAVARFAGRLRTFFADFFAAGRAVFRFVPCDDAFGRFAALALRGLCRATALRDFFLFLGIRCALRRLTTADKYRIVLCLSQIRGRVPYPQPQMEETLTV